MQHPHACPLPHNFPDDLGLADLLRSPRSVILRRQLVLQHLHLASALAMAPPTSSCARPRAVRQPGIPAPYAPRRQSPLQLPLRELRREHLASRVVLRLMYGKLDRVRLDLHIVHRKHRRRVLRRQKPHGSCRPTSVQQGRL